MNAFKHISITRGIQWRQVETLVHEKIARGLGTLQFLVQVILHTDLDEFGEGLVDEDEWDQEREDLLSETRDVSNQEASLKWYHEHHDYDEPEPNPYPTRQILQLAALTELLRDRVDKWWRHLILKDTFTVGHVLVCYNSMGQRVLFFIQELSQQFYTCLIYYSEKLYLSDQLFVPPAVFKILTPNLF